MFSVDERLDLIAATCADLPNVRVDRCGLLVDYMRNEGVTTMIRACGRAPTSSTRCRWPR